MLYRADYTAPTRQHELGRSDQEYSYRERFRSIMKLESIASSICAAWGVVRHVLSLRNMVGWDSARPTQNC